MSSMAFPALRGFLVFAPVVVAFVCSAQPVQAADAKGDFALLGGGALTCRAYMLGSTDDRLHAETWWSGYISAMNRVTDDTYDMLGEYSVEDFNIYLDDYCRDNPTDLFGIAVHEAAGAFYPERER